VARRPAPYWSRRRAPRNLGGVPLDAEALLRKALERLG
jgi:hypothetical protein